MADVIDPQSPYILARPQGSASASGGWTTAQSRAIAHTDGALLVLGGPGTGKTRTLAGAAAQMVGQDSRQPVVFCLSRSAAARMRDEIAQRVPGAVRSTLAVTMHAFCLAVWRRFADEAGVWPRLLTAPEQEQRMREMLGGRTAAAWPDDLQLAVGTRGFARELRGFLARGRQLGLDPADIMEAGTRHGVSGWESAGAYFEEYLDVLDAEGALDYAELIHRTRLMLGQPEVAQVLRAEISGVFVDDLQDLDPAQLGVLRALVPPGGHIVASADPDQAAYGFRGAHPRGLAEFLRLFSDPGAPAEINVLDHSFRLTTAARRVAGAVAERLPLPGLPGNSLARLRALEGDERPGVVRVVTLDTENDEALFVAKQLRRAHLVDGVAWSQMAVIVRSGRRSIPGLRRTLAAAGVPIEVAGDEIPLSAELAVRPLLLALSVVSGRTPLDADVAERLLASPLAGLDSVELRRIGRALRTAEREESTGELPRSSTALLAAALQDPDLFEGIDLESPPAAAIRLARCLREARDLCEGGAASVEVLWHVWNGTSWPTDIAADVAGGGPRSNRADRDLDAVCALFDVAQRADAFVGSRGVRVFLEEIDAQSIPGDTMQAGRVRGEAVRVLTVHRAKGLQWRRVFVVGVQEGVWPDLRSGEPLLQASALPEAPGGPDPGAAVSAARRLFYVAITRATEETTVTAVEGTDGEADHPSRFLREMGVAPTPAESVESPAVSFSELIVRLRRAATDATASEGLRRAAASRLARVADLGERAADPSRWWGMLPITGESAGQRPDVIALSGSQLGKLLSCPRQYFLSREVRADTVRTSAASLGSVIHALAQHALTDGLDPAQVSDALSSVWDAIGFDAAWLSVSERVEAENALVRLSNWSAANESRSVVGVEVEFRVATEVDGARVVLTGAVDRLERDDAGGLRIVDFKTGRHAPTQAEVAALDQLGVYQLAVTLGAFEDLAPGARHAGGGELVLLRQSERNPDFPKHMTQASLSDHPQPPESGDHPTWVHGRLSEAVKIVRDGSYPATPSDDACRFCAFSLSCPGRGGEQVVS